MSTALIRLVCFAGMGTGTLAGVAAGAVSMVSIVCSNIAASIDLAGKAGPQHCY